MALVHVGKNACFTALTLLLFYTTISVVHGTSALPLLGLALDRLALQFLSGVPCLVRNLLTGSTDGAILLECGTDGTTLLGGEGTTD